MTIDEWKAKADEIKANVDARMGNVQRVSDALLLIAQMKLLGPGEHARILERLGRYAEGKAIGMRIGKQRPADPSAESSPTPAPITKLPAQITKK